MRKAMPTHFWIPVYCWKVIPMQLDLAEIVRYAFACEVGKAYT